MFTSLYLDLPVRPAPAVQRGFSPSPRRSATMAATLELTHERVDDVPLLLSFLIQLRLPEVLDRHLPPHPLHQGLSNGWLITVWVVYILSQADHRKSPVQARADGLRHALETLIDQPLRPVEFSDDRLTLVLNRLSDPDAWHELEADLWHTQCDVYALPPVERVHLDATTSCGYHAVGADGLMQLGHSKDHRPDLPQIELMAATAWPGSLFLAGDVHPGHAADDPLYLPLYRRVRTLLDRTGSLYVGDCKMAAIETRAEVAAAGDFYLTRLPLTGEVAAQFATWVEAALTGEAVGEVEPTWAERVQIIRSEAAAASQAAALERRLDKAETAVRGLTPPPGPG